MRDMPVLVPGRDAIGGMTPHTDINISTQAGRGIRGQAFRMRTPS